MAKVTEAVDNELILKIKSVTGKSLNKELKLQSLRMELFNKYNQIIMGSYGEKISEIGLIELYKISEFECVTVNKFKNNLGQDCNYVKVQEMKDNNIYQDNSILLIKDRLSFLFKI